MTRTTAYDPLMPPSDGATGTSQSVERGLAILSSFDAERPLMGVSELARELDLNRSTAHRYISTLAHLGYLTQAPVTKRYRLGPKVLDLGFAAINSMDVREIAAPHLRALSDETGCTVNLAILDGADVVYIERCRTARPGQREIDLNLHVGSRLPAYCTALGKAIVAFCPRSTSPTSSPGTDFAARGPTRSPTRRASGTTWPGSGRPGSRSTTKSSHTGCARSPPDPQPRRRGRRGGQPSGAPDDGLDGRADRALRPPRPPHREPDLVRHGAPAGAALKRLSPLRSNIGTLS